MGIDQRRHPRFGVRLAVRYTNAAQFVNDYVENLSQGGLFLAGAHQLPLGAETEVQIELPGQGSWTVRARSVFVVDVEAAARTGRPAGAGMTITGKPPGFDDALLGYLLRLGRRRDHAIMVGDVPGIASIRDAGYRVLPLVSTDDAARAVADDAALVAIVVPPAQLQPYRARLDARGKELVVAAETAEDVLDILARIDSLL